MKKRVIIITIITLLVLSFGGYLYFTKEDKNSNLNIVEKKWIDNNKNVLNDISIYTNVPIFSYSSDGIVFDYLSSLEKNTGLDFNKVSYAARGDVKTEYAFMEKSELDDKDIVMYEDNYVLVTKKNIIYNSPREIKGITVGILNNTLDIVNNYLTGSDVTFKTFDSYKKMIEQIGVEVDAAVVPRVEFLVDILKDNSYTLSYNIDEYKLYYVLHLGNNNTLNSILTKYYKKWSSESFDKAFNNYLINIYFSKDEGVKSVAKLRSKRYVYGFVEEAPYDLFNDNNYIGVNSELIASFAKMAGISIEYKKFNNVSDLINAFNTNSIDIFFNNHTKHDYSLDVTDTVSPFVERVIVLTKNNENITVNSLYSIKNQKVGVLKESKIADYLKKYDIDVAEYDTISKLMSDSKISIKAIDSYNYNYYMNKGISNYHNSYEVEIDDEYFYTIRDISDNKDFANLFNFYLSYVPTTLLITNATINTLNTNNLLTIAKIALTILVVLVITFVVLYVIYKVKHRKGKKTTLSKEDKLKYIDMLTSLKNRNYLNDNIELWDEREVYPQTIIIVDLNNIAYINDNYGHAEGDIVIRDAANILIKTQNPNSEIIRTNGNEFLIYLVSYDEKQVLSYIKKLNKEFKDLAHGFGAAIGYSVINDAIKTIDDAINEATIDMKANKEEASKE